MLGLGLGLGLGLEAIGDVVRVVTPKRVDVVCSMLPHEWGSELTRVIGLC